MYGRLAADAQFSKLLKTTFWPPKIVKWLPNMKYWSPEIKKKALYAILCIGQIEASTCPAPPEHLTPLLSRRGGNLIIRVFQGVGNLKAFELHPRLHVKSLAWRAIMGDAVLEDFRGKDCAFVANWLRGKGLNKLCAVFEVFKF